MKSSTDTPKPPILKKSLLHQIFDDSEVEM